MPKGFIFTPDGGLPDGFNPQGADGSGAVTTKRDQIIGALKNALSTILIANGYYTDIGTTVKEWQVVPWQQADLPGIDLRDQEEIVYYAMQEWLVTLPVALAVVSDGDLAISDARLQMADIIKCIGDNLQLGGLCEDIVVSKTQLSVNHGEYKTTSISTTLEVQFTTDPFTLYAT